MKNLPEQYKKLILIGGTAVVAVWIFCLVFVISYKSQEKKANLQTTTFLTQIATTAESTTESTTLTEKEEPATFTQVSMDGNNVTTSAEYVQPSWAEQSKQDESSSIAASEAQLAMPKTTDEIVKYYNDSVNTLKNVENFTLVKTNTLKITVEQVTAGLDSIVQKYIDNNSDSSPRTYHYVNGNDSATGSSPNSEIAPSKATSTMSSAGVKSAKCEQSSSGGYKITIMLKDDSQTISTPAKNYASCMDVFTVESLNLDSSIKIDTLDVNYTNGRIIAETDSAGRIVSIQHYLEISKAAGSGKVAIIPAQLQLSGSNAQSYQISY